MSQSEIKGKELQLAPRAGRHITCFKRGKTYNLCQARANIQHLLSAGKRNLCQAWDNACKPCVSRAMLCLVLFEKKKNEWPERAWAHVLSFYFFFMFYFDCVLYLVSSGVNVVTVVVLLLQRFSLCLSLQLWWASGFASVLSELWRETVY